ncbi:MAG: hypothetical protein IKD25_04250, partial [Bacteroidaceae bacterium]|nr:hypothetical protein [Bacteroidaceae bacterium]
MDNPLSLVPTEGNSTEFPVLKAFQEYIDAEQAKARKRMLGLSVFFIVLLSVVVVTFVLILTTVLNRNQSLSDRLLDYALKERDRVPVVQSSQPSADIVKTLVERLEKEQAQMKLAFEQQKRDAEEKAAAAERKRAEELKRIQRELAEERAKAQKDADKKAEIERHRRRLYPDYYRMETREELPIPPPSSSYKMQKTAPVKIAESSKKQISVKSTPLP